MLALLALVALMGVACDQPAERPPRLLVIGIDGASPRVMDRLVAEGQVPNLSALAKRGAYGPLRSERPIFSPRIWNTMATGKHPREHGILSFVSGVGEERYLFTGVHREVPAIWNILSNAGRSVGVVNWWTTYPPENINGVMVSDHFFPEHIDGVRRMFSVSGESSGALVSPAEFEPLARLAVERSAEIETLQHDFGPETALPPWVTRADLIRHFRSDHEIARVALEVQSRTAPDVMLVFMPGIDRVSHWLWGCLEPPDLYPPGLRPTPEDREGCTRSLETYYRVTDGLIGQLVADYSEQDHVLVVSDHGFEAGENMMLLTGRHRTEKALDGVIFAAGRWIRPASDIGTTSIYDIMPMLLSLSALPIASDLEGKLPDFVSAPDLPQVSSYDDTPVERVQHEESGMEDTIIEQLRVLGYFEEEAEAAIDERGGRDPSAD